MTDQDNLDLLIALLHTTNLQIENVRRVISCFEALPPGASARANLPVMQYVLDDLIEQREVVTRQLEAVQRQPAAA